VPTSSSQAAPAAAQAAEPSEAPSESVEKPPQRDFSVLSASENEAVAKVLARMQRAGDFPAFVKNVSVISAKADVEGDASANQLGDAILQDYALTAKLLRIVNSSFYDRFGTKINNVSRAVVVLGFERVRSLALGISIFRNPGNKPHARQLADLSIAALVSGEIARGVAKQAGLRDAEEAMICAMFQNLGHHLVVYYLPEVYDQILEAQKAGSLDIETAAEQVLGVSLRALGIAVVQKWRLSRRLTAAMVPGPIPHSKPKTDEERLRLLSSFANELCAAVASTSPEDRGAVLNGLLDRYKHVVTIPRNKFDDFLGSVQKSFTERYSFLLGLKAQGNSFFKKVDAWRGAQAQALPPPSTRTPAAAASPPQAVASADPVADALARRIEAIASRLKGRHEADEVLKAVLDAYVYTLGFRRMLALMVDRSRVTLRVRGASGEDAELLKRDFALPLAPLGAADVFSSTYHGMKSTVVTDAFDEKMTKRVPRLYYEMIGSRALWADGWKAVVEQPQGEMMTEAMLDAQQWELYQVEQDFSECTDLAAEHPAKLKELVERWWVEAGKYNVLPLDSRMQTRMGERKPSTVPSGNRYVYYPGMAPQFEYTAVNLKNRSHTITAEVEIPEGGAEGVLLAHGSWFAGYSLYVKDRRLVYVHNYLGLEEHRIVSTAEVPAGRVVLAFRFTRTGEHRGRGCLLVDGREVGAGEIPRTIPAVIETSGEGLCCGYDSGVPVTPDYVSPFRFTGRIARVVVETGEPGAADDGAALRAALNDH